jgi:hypothetical protein
MAGMSEREHLKFIRFYVGNSSPGFLNGISDIRELETFCLNRDLEIDPRSLKGTNKDKFEQILKESEPAEQASIIRAMLDKFPPDPDALTTRTQALHDELDAVAARLEGVSPVPAKNPKITCASVDRCIKNAEKLIGSGEDGTADAVDRLHTMLHGYLRAVCDDVSIPYGEKTMMSGLFGLIRSQHPAFKNEGPRKDDLKKMFRAMSDIMDAMNPIRNEGSLAHPNNELLAPPEAALVINIARTILHYIDTKVSD